MPPHCDPSEDYELCGPLFTKAVLGTYVKYDINYKIYIKTKMTTYYEKAVWAYWVL